MITFALEDETADVYPLNVVLSLFETELEIRTPYGNLQISSGLLGEPRMARELSGLTSAFCRVALCLCLRFLKQSRFTSELAS